MMGVWEKMMMGFASSPYLITKYLLEVEYLTRGYQYDLQNVFQWYRSILNLPGMKDYQTSCPWLYTLRVDIRLANDFFSTLMIVDQQLFSGNEGWHALRAIGIILSFLGAQ